MNSSVFTAVCLLSLAAFATAATTPKPPPTAAQLSMLPVTLPPIFSRLRSTTVTLPKRTTGLPRSTTWVLSTTTPLPGTTTEDPCAPTADTQGFSQLLKDLEDMGAIQAMNIDLRVYPYEMLVAAKTDKLTGMLDVLGYATLIKTIDQLPKPYQKEFIKHLIDHLEEEQCRKMLQNSS